MGLVCKNSVMFARELINTIIIIIIIIIIDTYIARYPLIAQSAVQ